MSEEIGIEEARKNLGDIANRAHYAGRVTYITRRGQRIAAIVPVTLIPQEKTMTAKDISLALDRSGEDDGWNWADAALEQWTAAAEKAGLSVEVASWDVPDVNHDAGIVEADGVRYRITVRNDEISATAITKTFKTSTATVTLYETNGSTLVIARGDDDVWSLYVAGDHMEGMFAKDAEAWIDGDWEPSESDGQNPTDLDDDLKEVATWDQAKGLVLSVRRNELGAAARDYIGDKVTLISATSGDKMPEGAKELAESGTDWDDLPEDAQEWASEQGYGNGDDELLYVISGEVEFEGWPTRTVSLSQ